MKRLLGTALLLTMTTTQVNANPTVVFDNQVIATIDNQKVTHYEYDAIGNITKEGSKKFEYSDAGQLEKMSDSESTREFLYDEFGRMTYNGSADIAYDSQNSMMNLFKTMDTKVSYGYDELSGLRNSKTVDGKVTNFVLDDEGRVIEERSSDGELVAQIIWDGDLPSKYVYNGQTYDYVCNSYGDVIALLDQDGKKVNSYSYDIWGKLESSEETVPNAIRYRHEYYDTESGFYYLRGRYYDPSIRRFTTPDPAEDGINWYSYCGNNPLDYIDPSGYAKFILTEKVRDGYRLRKYYSGKDLAPLFKKPNAKEQLLSSLGGQLVDCSKALRLLFALPRAQTWLDSNILSDVAYEAFEEDKGIAIDMIVSSDGGTWDVPTITKIDAKIVEDLASGKRRP